MAKSLQEQLLGAGLVSDAKAKTIKTNKRKQTKAQRKNKSQQASNDVRDSQAQARAEQAEKDRLLNQQKQQQAEKKALAAQIKQLLESGKVEQDEDGEVYNFTDGSKVKRIYLNAEKREQLASGRIGIIRLENRYELVTVEVANKIRERDEGSLVLLNERKVDDKPAEDDPYADYQIPDDLMW